MSIRRILEYPDPKLREHSEPVKRFGTPYLRHLIVDMHETMRYGRGVGLAAPQIGVLLQIVTYRFFDEAHALQWSCLINPVVTDAVGSRLLTEACLSFPGMEAEIMRHERVTVKYVDADGNPKEIVARGRFSHILEHEIDHLSGRLYIDYLEGGVLPRKQERG